MCMYMYIHIHIYIYMCIYVYIDILRFHLAHTICTHIHMHICIYKYIRLCLARTLYICTNIYTYIYTYTYIYIYIHIFTYTYIYTCTHICVHICIFAFALHIQWLHRCWSRMDRQSSHQTRLCKQQTCGGFAQFALPNLLRVSWEKAKFW